MYRWHTVLCMFVLGLTMSPALMFAQGRERWEVGMSLAGLAILDRDVVVQLPGTSFQGNQLIDANRQAFGGTPVAYGRYYVSAAHYVEPQVGFRQFWGQGFSSHVGFFGLDLGHRFRADSDGPLFYGSGSIGVLWVDDGQRNDMDYAYGFGGGYWIPLLDRHAALAFDLRARSWLESDRWELVASVRLSLLFGDRSN